MATMDLSTNQEVMGVQSIYEHAQHMFKPKETFEETDIQGNINLFNTLKTEANGNHDHDSSSLFQVKCLNENKFEVDNDLFSYSSFKKAMDLRTHNRTLDGVRRTIFDDAEYFAKNYCYKLLPITLEPVDETVIQSEHNYSLMSLNSESEPEGECSRTMDYSQIKEKNYKRRRTKFREGSDAEEELVHCESFDAAPNGFCPLPALHFELECSTPEEERPSASPDSDCSGAVEPLDLSAAPLVQEEKTDSYPRESLSSIVENDEVAQLDSDKENVNSELKGILVTITRPDEKENYQPCDLFLNDIARLVPRLIDKECVEVDIMDRTCERHDEFRKHRLYYVISESTWRLFQKTNERVILTNDQSLGQPLRKAEKDERPSYLVFDQFSLAKCLADYCQEIGGCFEYTCVEEGREGAGSKEEEGKALEVTTAGEQTGKIEETVQREEKTIEVTQGEPEEKESDETMEKEEPIVEVTQGDPEEEKIEKMEETVEKGEPDEKKTETVETTMEREETVVEVTQGEPKEDMAEKMEETVEKEETVVEVTQGEPKEEKIEKMEETVEKEEPDEEKTEAIEKTMEKEETVVEVTVGEPNEEKTEKVSCALNGAKNSVETVPEASTESKEAEQDFPESDQTTQGKSTQPKEEKTAETAVPPPEPEENSAKTADETKQKPPDEETQKEAETAEHVSPEKAVVKGQNKIKKKSRGTKRKRKSSIQRKPKNSRTIPQSKSASESETSQKSDKPVSRKGRREQVLSKEEPPNKLSKPSDPAEPFRKTRSGKVLQEVKTNRPVTRKKKPQQPQMKEEAGKRRQEQKETSEEGKRRQEQKVTSEEGKRREETGRSLRLRSHKATQWKEKVQTWSKTKGKKR